MVMGLSTIQHVGNTPLKRALSESSTPTETLLPFPLEPLMGRFFFVFFLCFFLGGGGVGGGGPC